MSGKFLHEENSRTVLTVGASGSVNANKFPQYLAATLATLGAFAAGACLSWTSPALPLLTHPDAQVQLSAEQGSWVGSILTLGAFLGAIPAGIATNTLGRKLTLQVLALPMLLSWIFIANSTCVVSLYISRLLAGVSIGAISVAAPLYVSELAEPRVRGALGTLFQLQMTVGILFEYFAGAMIQNFAILAYISAALPAVFLLTFSFMPESPVYLKSKRKDKEARQSLQWFRGTGYDIEDELTRIGDTIDESLADKASHSDLLKSRATVRALVISLGLMVFQQLSGVNAVIFYTSNIFKDAGSTLEPSLCTIIVGIVQVIATYISTLLMDRAGRRVLLIVSDAVMTVCLFALSLYFYLKDHCDVTAYAWVPLVSVALFIVVFSLGFGPIPWLMMGEIFPANVKGPASSLAAAFNWLLAFTVTKVFQNMIDTFGLCTTFCCFAVICLLGTVFVIFIVPETKGKDMEEIQAELAGEDYNGTVILSVERGTKISMVN